MKKRLYPLKFEPQFVEKIWGGNKLATLLEKPADKSKRIGESWEISGVQGSISTVSNGFLAGNNLQELIEVYMGDLVGEKIYKKFGIEFPLLIKFIDAEDDLSIQVHPDDALARQRHNAYGKTEMWYILDAGPGAQLISGFSKATTPQGYKEYLNAGKLPEILNYEAIQRGDVYFIPAGRVHAIGKGTLLTEIQQTSDVTYRIYDYDRRDANGNLRELHTGLALDAIDYSTEADYKTHYKSKPNDTASIIASPYFTTNLLDIDKKIIKDYNKLDSFVIYICTEGQATLSYHDGQAQISLKKGETLLIPNEIEQISLQPHGHARIIETYIEENGNG